MYILLTFSGRTGSSSTVCRKKTTSSATAELLNRCSFSLPTSSSLRMAPAPRKRALTARVRRSRIHSPSPLLADDAAGTRPRWTRQMFQRRRVSIAYCNNNKNRNFINMQCCRVICKYVPTCAYVSVGVYFDVLSVRKEYWASGSGDYYIVHIILVVNLFSCTSLEIQ